MAKRVCNHVWADGICQRCHIRRGNHHTTPRPQTVLSPQQIHDIGTVLLVLDRAIGTDDRRDLILGAYRAHRLLDNLAEELQIDLSEIDT